MGRLRAWEAVRSGGAHSIFLIKNMKSATAFMSGHTVYLPVVLHAI